MPNSVNDQIRTRIEPEKIPGMMSGSVILNRRFILEAPREAAASSSAGSMFASAARMLR